MTEPLLETNYTRALRLLGLRPASRQLSTPLTVQSVQIVTDVSDVSIPHSNPIFGVGFGIVGVAAEHSTLELAATSRLIRLRQVFLPSMTTPKIFIAAATTITRLIGTATGVSLGPVVAVGTAIASRGNSTAIPTAGAYGPDAVQFDVRPPLLIAPGFRAIFKDQTLNTTVGVNLIYEEIPPQEAVADLGFPSA